MNELRRDRRPAEGEIRRPKESYLSMPGEA
jgi:hypothetical protein